MNIIKVSVLSILSIIMIKSASAMQQNTIPVEITNHSDKYIGIIYYDGNEYQQEDALPLQNIQIDSPKSVALSINLYNGLSKFVVTANPPKVGGNSNLIRLDMVKDNNGEWQTKRALDRLGPSLQAINKLTILIKPDNSVQLLPLIEPNDGRPTGIPIATYKKLAGDEFYASPAEILGFNIYPSLEQAREAYKKLSRQWHPDKNTDSSAILLINWAAEKLGAK